MTNTEESLKNLPREQLAEFLPEALRKAITSYHKHASRSITGKPDEFGNMHKDLKAAVAHIELLVKLAELAELPDKAAADQNTQAMLAGWLEKANEDITGFKRGESGKE